MLPHPLSHLLVLRVAPLAPRFQKVRVSADTAHIFRMAGSLPIQTPRIRRVIFRRGVTTFFRVNPTLRNGMASQGAVSMHDHGRIVLKSPVWMHLLPFKE